MVNNNLGGNFWCQREGCAVLGQAGLGYALCPARPEFAQGAKVLGLEAGWDMLLDCPLRCFEWEEISYWWVDGS